MITAIVNPTSADGKTAKAWPQIRTALEAELGTIQVLFTRAQYHAAELAHHAILHGTTTVIAVGGDGTINEAVNGLCQSGLSNARHVQLAIIVRGTGSDFARSWIAPPTIADVARAIKQGAPYPCDVVRMVSEPLNNSAAERYYINVADVGVGGRVADIVNNSPKFLGGGLSFLLAGLRATLFQYINAPLDLELDGRTLCTDARHYFVAVANGQYFGGGMHIAPHARLDDGLFDIVLVGDLTLPEKVYFASKLYRGKAGELRKVQMLRGRHLSIRSPHNVFIEADGELVGTTDAHFEILPSALNVLGLTPRFVP